MTGDSIALPLTQGAAYTPAIAKMSSNGLREGYANEDDPLIQQLNATEYPYTSAIQQINARLHESIHGMKGEHAHKLAYVDCGKEMTRGDVVWDGIHLMNTTYAKLAKCIERPLMHLEGGNAHHNGGGQSVVGKLGAMGGF